MSTLTVANAQATETQVDLTEASRLISQGIGNCKKLHDPEGYVRFTILGEKMPTGFNYRNYGAKSLSKLAKRLPEQFEITGAGHEMRVRTRRKR